LIQQTTSAHPIHQDERIWAETNCYTDICIELLHAWGFDPVAALPFTLSIDCEGDQWTFFKFRPGDLEELYRLAVEELTVWRPLVRHVEEQVSRGRPVLVELDSYYLPDTAGTAYRLEHVKTTVAVVAIDVANQYLATSITRAIMTCAAAISTNCFASLNRRTRQSCRPMWRS